MTAVRSRGSNKMVMGILIAPGAVPSRISGTVAVSHTPTAQTPAGTR